MHVQSKGKTPTERERGTKIRANRMLFITIVITEFGPSLDQASFFTTSSLKQISPFNPETMCGGP